MVLVAAFEIPKLTLPKSYEHCPLLPLLQKLIMLFDLFALLLALQQGSKVSPLVYTGMRMVGGKDHPEVQVAKYEQM